MNTLENNNSATSKELSIERSIFAGGAGDHLQSAIDEIHNLRKNDSLASNNSSPSDNSASNPSSASKHLPGLELYGAADKPSPAASSSLEQGSTKPADGVGAAAPAAPDAPHNARPKSGNDSPASGSSAEHAAASTNPATASQMRPEVTSVGERLPFSGF